MTFLSPLDLLAVTDTEQDILRCLIRQPHLTAAEIAQRTKLPLTETRNLLNQLIKNSYLAQESKNGQPVYFVPLRQDKKRKRSSKNLLDTLFD
jgi:predicted transcriptional regulator